MTGTTRGFPRPLDWPGCTPCESSSPAGGVGAERAHRGFLGSLPREHRWRTSTWAEFPRDPCGCRPNRQTAGDQVLLAGGVRLTVAQKRSLLASIVRRVDVAAVTTGGSAAAGRMRPVRGHRRGPLGGCQGRVPARPPGRGRERGQRRPPLPARKRPRNPGVAATVGWPQRTGIVALSPSRCAVAQAAEAAFKAGYRSNAISFSKEADVTLLRGKFRRSRRGVFEPR